MKKKYHKTGTIILSLFIAAVICIIVIVIMIYQTGLRYMKTSSGVKYFGNMDKSDNITDGRMWFEDTVAGIQLQKFFVVEINDANISESLKILNITSSDDVLKMINEILPKEMTDYFPLNNFIFNSSDNRILFHKETFDAVIKKYESSKNNVKSGEIYTSDGKKWILTSTKTSASSYKDFEVTQESDKSKSYNEDLLKFISDEQISFASFKLADGNIINLYPAHAIYRIHYEKGSRADDLYIGTVDDNLSKNGRGLYYFNNSGDIYYGDFVKDVKTGYCEILLSQGDSYVGNIIDGRKEGSGIFKWSDGWSYSGEFKNNMQNGYGINVFDDGSVYEGDYVDNVKHGQGKFTFANGDVYEGTFANDLFEGKGKYTWASGEYYEGDFIHSAMYGRGVYYWTTGRTYDGWFADGKMVTEEPPALSSANISPAEDTSESESETGN